MAWNLSESPHRRIAVGNELLAACATPELARTFANVHRRFTHAQDMVARLAALEERVREVRNQRDALAVQLTVHLWEQVKPQLGARAFQRVHMPSVGDFVAMTPRLRGERLPLLCARLRTLTFADTGIPHLLEALELVSLSLALRTATLNQVTRWLDQARMARDRLVPAWDAAKKSLLAK